MKNLFIDLQSEIHNQLHYPSNKLSTREDAIRHLQMPLWEFNKLRKAGTFKEYKHLGVIFFINTELFTWAYENKPEVTNFRIDFGQD